MNPSRLLRLVVAVPLVTLALLPSAAKAAFTESLPLGTFMLDLAYNHSFLSNNWDNDKKLAPLISPIDLYEPGGGKQGRLIPNADVEYSVLVMQLQYGVVDWLSVAVGLPLVLNTTVEPSLVWEPGDFQPQLGRPYSDEDFWGWAGSMGQPKPGVWQGNQGVVSDLVVGFRLRFSDWFKAFDEADLGMAFSMLGALPTGSPPDADEPVSVGTTLWDLQTQGDLAMHLGIDKKFSRRLDGRLVLGLNLHYEIFFPRTLKAPTGRKHPLLMNVAPYVGTDYVLDPGDYYGFSVSADVVAIKGRARGTWLVKGDVQRALALPPLLTLSIGYTFNGNLQSRFHSQSDLWDYDQEEKWQAGYRHVFRGTALFSFLRVGVPLQWYAGYRTMQLIPGQNARAGHVIVSGLRVPFKF